MQARFKTTGDPFTFVLEWENGTEYTYALHFSEANGVELTGPVEALAPEPEPQAGTGDGGDQAPEVSADSQG